MTDFFRLAGTYDQSYPPSLWGGGGTPAGPPVVILSLSPNPATTGTGVSIVVEGELLGAAVMIGAAGPFSPQATAEGANTRLDVTFGGLVNAGTWDVVVTGSGRDPSAPWPLTVTVGAFDPGAYTIPDVLAYVDAHPDELAAVRDAEYNGKARVTLLDELDARLAGTPA